MPSMFVKKNLREAIVMPAVAKTKKFLKAATFIIAWIDLACQALFFKKI
jgi:hypothetical protein